MKASKPACRRVGKINLSDLLVLAVQSSALLGGCAALHRWLAG